MEAAEQMHATVIQHVPFEGPQAITSWLLARGYRLHGSHPYAGEPLPNVDQLDLLVVMGGPMGVHDEHLHPWLAEEKKLIADTIAAGKPVLGICLGAQLIAHVLGASVSRNPEPEIGWFPVRPVSDHPLASLFSDQPGVLHWHGDTFATPEGAERLLASDACADQAFIYNNQVLGLQFHLETTAEGVAALVDHCGDELVEGPWIETAQALRQGAQRCESLHHYLFRLLDQWLPRQPASPAQPATSW